MKAIQTKILPATNTKPTRIKASAEGVKSITVTRSAAEDAVRGLPNPEEQVHQFAAGILAAVQDWPVEFKSVGLPDGSWAHCFVESGLTKRTVRVYESVSVEYDVEIPIGLAEDKIEEYICNHQPPREQWVETVEHRSWD